jgi:hypothetical protein
MAHIVDDMLEEADRAIAAMRDAALNARRLHARAELMRHMRTTARKVSDRPIAEAVRFVAGEWMKAWGIDEAASGSLAASMEDFTEAFCRDAHGSSAATGAAISSALERLERALAQEGTSLADQMAFHSECAHGWWELVVPLPAAMERRSAVPRWQPGLAFWDVGAAEHCLKG